MADRNTRRQEGVGEREWWVNVTIGGRVGNVRTFVAKNSGQTWTEVRIGPFSVYFNGNPGIKTGDVIEVTRASLGKCRDGNQNISLFAGDPTSVTRLAEPRKGNKSNGGRKYGKASGTKAG